MITRDEVRQIAVLARIGLDEKELEKYSKDLSSILDWVKQLEEVDISGIEPTAHIAGLENVDREDKISDFENKDGIVKLFPESKDGYDKVKSVL
ncbi:MAG TPA: Asp-tRNA(Asn)/Glu-tRNA(Gln) amidotransferase subunit GatB [Candidatus Moranbacteria bacterium]|nr:Asp-tRNA(Asn)/Glu-tRNA(Gln) amidotransferase subunit GatB [Candidatus Moranbacteria bacterium]HAT74479.1 Asp-tRNA(Asn)/Glu-tRNA(Gln) amidotransferase subunit GatB [Candidatus Moranbacteria bacterium]